MAGRAPQGTASRPGVPQASRPSTSDPQGCGPEAAATWRAAPRVLAARTMLSPGSWGSPLPPPSGLRGRDVLSPDRPLEPTPHPRPPAGPALSPFLVLSLLSSQFLKSCPCARPCAPGVAAVGGAGACDTRPGAEGPAPPRPRGAGTTVRSPGDLGGRTVCVAAALLGARVGGGALPRGLPSRPEAESEEDATKLGSPGPRSGRAGPACPDLPRALGEHERPAFGQRGRESRGRLRRRPRAPCRRVPVRGHPPVPPSRPGPHFRSGRAGPTRNFLSPGQARAPRRVGAGAAGPARCAGFPGARSRGRR